MIRLEQLTAGAGQRDRVTLDQPLDHLLACHRRIEERLEILERAAGHLRDRREEATEAIGNCFRFLDSNGAWHTADEEESVFPRLRGRIKEREEEFLCSLEADHRVVEQLYGEIKSRFEIMAAAASVPSTESMNGFRELAGRLCGLYRKHIAAEDTNLVSLGRDVLDESQLIAIAREMKARRGLAL